MAWLFILSIELLILAVIEITRHKSELAFGKAYAGIVSEILQGYMAVVKFIWLL